MSLRRRLAILVGIGMTPPLLLVMINTVRWQVHHEEDIHAGVVADARLLSTEVTQIVENSRDTMTILSKFSSAPGDEAACTAYFKSVVDSLPLYRYAAIIDSDGKFHCATIPIPPDLDVKDRAYFKEPLETGHFAIGTFTTGRASGQPLIHLSMPYKAPDGSMSGVIALGLNPDRMAEDLAGLPWHPRDRIIVVDRDGKMVLTFPPTHVSDAESIAAVAFKQAQWRAPESLEVDALPDRPQIIGAAPVSVGSGSFGVMVAVDRTNAMADSWRYAARNLAAALTTILLAIGLVYLVTHILITRPMRALVEVARRREAGDTTAKFPRLKPTTEFGELSAALSRMSARVDDLLAQKALFLRELQHRVMNSLNLLSSMFDIQRRKSETTEVARTQLASARNRVIALGTVYRHLYNNDAVDNIEVSELLKFIGRESASAYDGPVKLAIDVDADPLLLSGTNAISLGMLTHELIMNSIKHAFTEGETGQVTVSLKRAEGEQEGFIYRFADRGRGLPKDFTIDKSDSLGMIMITATARQLGGKLTINDLAPGTEFVLELPASIQETDKDAPIPPVAGVPKPE
jgi:two-component sensor histidine kinase